MKKRIEFFLYSGMLALDVTGPLDVFQAANELLSNNNREREGYEFVFSALEPGPVPTSSGLKLHADSRQGMQATESLLVPGGMVAEAISHDPVIVQAVRIAAQKAQRIVSICSGAFLLAAAGLLNGHRVTTHWKVADRLAECYPEVCVESDAIYIQDGNIATSAGATAGIDLALALVEDDYGLTLAIEVARFLILYRRRLGNQSQFSTPLAIQTQTGKRFKDLIDWVQEQYDKVNYMAAVCTGGLILQKAGLLKGRKATTHWMLLDDLKNDPEVTELPDMRYVRDGKIVTSQGVSAGIDMALWLVGEIHTPDHARMVRKILQYDPAPPYTAEV